MFSKINIAQRGMVKMVNTVLKCYDILPLRITSHAIKMLVTIGALTMNQSLILNKLLKQNS